MADENVQDDADKPEGTNDTNDDDSNASGDAGTSNDASDDARKGDDVVTRAEFEQIKARMQAADKAKAAAEQKLKDLEKKDLSELERAKTDLEDFKKQNEQLLAQLDQMTLQNAFLTDNKHTWHDPSDALALLDREGVEVKDGNVTGLGAAIEKLAKAKPHLLKSEKDGDGKDDSSAASGSANNGRRKGDDKKDKVDYSGRFPALKR